MLETKKQLEGLKSRVCKPMERWNDSRCKDFCEVNELCPYYQQNYMV